MPKTAIHILQQMPLSTEKYFARSIVCCPVLFLDKLSCLTLVFASFNKIV